MKVNNGTALETISLDTASERTIVRDWIVDSNSRSFICILIV